VRIEFIALSFPTLKVLECMHRNRMTGVVGNHGHIAAMKSQENTRFDRWAEVAKYVPIFHRAFLREKGRGREVFIEHHLMAFGGGMLIEASQRDILFRVIHNSSGGEITNMRFWLNNLKGFPDGTVGSEK